MRRIVALLSVVFLLMASMAVSIGAQDATPPAGGMEPPERLEIEPGVFVDNMLFPEGAMVPLNYRLTYEPGAGHTVESSPNLEVIYAESGSLTATLDGAVTITRLGDVESGGEVIPAGTEFTLEAGHFIVVQPGVSGEVRNEGSEPAVISIAGLTPASGPTASPEATPAT